MEERPPTLRTSAAYHAEGRGPCLTATGVAVPVARGGQGRGRPAPPWRGGCSQTPVLAGRKPRLLFLLSGELLFRLAARTLCGVLFQLPPRFTRLEPPLLDPSVPRARLTHRAGGCEIGQVALQAGQALRHPRLIHLARFPVAEPLAYPS
jgi:hypothetical protein